MELGCHSWTDCLAAELFSTLGSPSTVFVTLFRTTVERASCKSTQFASHWQGRHHLNVYCSGGGSPYVVSVDIKPKQTNTSDLLLQSPELCAQRGVELSYGEVSCTFFCFRLFSTVVSLDTVLTIPACPMLALCALLTGVILKGLTLRKYGLEFCVCMFYFMFV